MSAIDERRRALQRIRETLAEFARGDLSLQTFLPRFKKDLGPFDPPDLSTDGLSDSEKAELTLFIELSGGWFGENQHLIPRRSDWQYGTDTEPFGWIDTQAYRDWIRDSLRTRRADSCDLVTDQLDAAILSLGYHDRVRRCGKPETDGVFANVQEAFVDGSPRAWWNALKGTARTVSHPDGDGAKHLMEHVPAEAKRCWLLFDEGSPAAYELDCAVVGDLLMECQHFEYYVVALDLSWMVLENDHNELIVVVRPSASTSSGDTGPGFLPSR
jgi:hypothetical protein